MRKWAFITASAITLLFEPIDIKIYTDIFPKETIKNGVRSWRLQSINIKFVDTPTTANFIVKQKNLSEDLLYEINGKELNINSKLNIKDYELEGLTSYAFGKFLSIPETEKHSVMNPSYSIARKRVTKYDSEYINFGRIRVFLSKIKNLL